MPSFYLVEHTADVQLAVKGETISKLFENAMHGMFFIMEPAIASCSMVAGNLHCSSWPITKKIDIQGSDLESLLVNFLSEILFLCDAYNEIYGLIDIQHLDKNHIVATLKGITLGENDALGLEIKAVTYHDLSIIHDQTGWHTTIVFDI